MLHEANVCRPRMCPVCQKPRTVDPHVSRQQGHLSEPFYMPDPSLFGHTDAYNLFTKYAARLEAAALTDRFPPEPEVRHIAIELLAERYAAEDVQEEPDSYIPDAVQEARQILAERRDR